MKLSIVILAAGQGTRMQSSLAKVLQPIAGIPMLAHIVNTSLQLDPHNIIIIYGNNETLLKTALKPYLPEKTPDKKIAWIQQAEPLGTGHAVLQALPYITSDKVLILYGDVPLISLETLQILLNKKNNNNNSIGLITADLENPTGLGRVLRNNQGEVEDIIEHKDAFEGQLGIKEIFTGIIVIPLLLLKKYLPVLNNHNTQKEYYLPGIISLVTKQSCPIYTIKASCLEEVQGVNDLGQLALLERFYQYRQACVLLKQGVHIMDPHRFDLRGILNAGKNNQIDNNTLMEGKIIMGDNVKIGPNVILRNVIIGNNVFIKSHSVIEDSIIEDDCQIGPFAHLRPGSYIEKNAKIGNFVETKNTRLGAGSKACHLSYLGDAEIGKNVNIGAGVITCNYDGVNKHVTRISNNVFIGSHASLIAPLTIGENATVGAGSVISKNAPPDQLTLSRVKQRSIENWLRPKKED